MLPKENRLKLDKDFKRVYKKGEFFATKLIHFKYLKTNLPHTRVGFVVGLKVYKKAYKRNLLKRRMRAVFNLNLDKIKHGFDIVVIAKPGSADMEYGEIEKNIKYFLEKTRLLEG